MPAAAKLRSAETRDLLDEIETVLENWEWSLRGDLEIDLSVPRRYGSESLIAAHAFDSEALSLIPAVRKGCRGASKLALESLIAALRVGLLIGLSQQEPYKYHHDRYRYEIKPDVDRGLAIKHAATLGGKERWRNRKDKTREQAIERFRQLQETHPRRSRTDICQQVGRELKRSGRQIQRYIATTGMGGIGHE
jgi:hypothetical protein